MKISQEIRTNLALTVIGLMLLHPSLAETNSWPAASGMQQQHGHPEETSPLHLQVQVSQSNSQFFALLRQQQNKGPF